jgi:hypothetical protein
MTITTITDLMGRECWLIPRHPKTAEGRVVGNSVVIEINGMAVPKACGERAKERVIQLFAEGFTGNVSQVLYDEGLYPPPATPIKQ